jgi:non-specific serine/threonine protein kinase/serine/threonine-protein kinase
VQRRVLGPEHRDTLATIYNLALLYQDQNDDTQAEPLFSKLLEVRRRVAGPQHPTTLAAINAMASVYLKEGKYGQAEPLLREELSGYPKGKTDSWDRFNCESLLGGSLAGQEMYLKAEPLLLSGYEGLHRQESTVPFSRRVEVKHAAERIVQLYEAWGRTDKAADWRKKVQTIQPSAARPQ